MRKLPALTLLLAALGAPALAAELPDYRFKVETLVEGIPQPMEIEVAPDGRIFFNEYKGALKIYHPDTRRLVEAGKLEVFDDQENGFLGFALDPKFSENGWIYCLYSPRGFAGQHLSRFTMKGETLDLASERLILKFEEQRKECCHHAGSVEFGPDGLLYFSTGDNTHPHGDSEGYAPLDERPERAPWDAQKSAANTNTLGGKILRIRVKADATYEIPEGNLFSPGTEKTRPEIYVMGCRNPWRMSVDAKTGFVYWGEVGPDARQDGPRGPRGYDEINQAKRAGNFGWPYFIGNNFAYFDFAYETKQVGGQFDSAKPINESPNNTGRRDLPAAQPAMIYWPYVQPTEFREMGEGGRTACAGPVFRWRAEFAATNGFPEDFDGWLLFWDWERPTIRWAKLDADSKFLGIAPFTGAVVTANKADQIARAASQIANGAALLKRPVDAVFGPDGCLYLMDYGATWGANQDAKIVKISYLRGNLPPQAVAKADQTAGREPLTVELNGEGSKDRDGKIVSYDWKLIGGAVPMSAAGARAKLTIQEPGNYRAELCVTDEGGASSKTSLALIVGNAAPQVKFESPQPGDFFTPGQAIKYRVSVNDAEDGSSSAKRDEFSVRTLISSAFVGPSGAAAAGDPGLELMKSSDCFNCHQVEQKLVGPAFLEVADRYRGQPAALDAAVQRVRAGSTGVWGQVAMLPHQQHTTDEVTIMLRWVFGLEKGKTATALARGLEGEITVPKDANNAGSFLLEATYSDLGRPPAGSLSHTARIALRSHRVEAESGEMNGPTIRSNGAASGKKEIGSINDRHFVKFPAINLGEVGGITARAASGNVGGKIEFHAGSPEGRLLGSVEIPNSGGWDKWIEQTSAIPPALAERTDVFAVFVNPGKAGLMNVDWVQFNPR